MGIILVMDECRARGDDVLEGLSLGGPAISLEDTQDSLIGASHTNT